MNANRLSNSISFIAAFVLLMGILFGCSVKWTKAIRNGYISTPNPNQVIPISTQKNLIFVPVILNGKEYNFLLDSGAPFSISKKIQNEFQYKIISHSHLVDSDNNRKPIDWAKIPSLKIGNVTFSNQTAFIGDFEANPVLKCLGIDGILGANILRQSNWIIDQENLQLTLKEELFPTDTLNGFSIPFHTNNQFNMYVNFKIGKAKFKNVLVDIGSNGEIQLNKTHFQTLINAHIVSNVYQEMGWSQSGIVGTPIKQNDQFTFTDSVKIAALHPEHVYVGTGKTTSIGNKFLARFKVIINWNEHKIHFIPTRNHASIHSFAGFSLGLSNTNETYVLSVVKNSNAYYAGLRPNQKVTQLNHINFTIPSNFCDYIFQDLSDTITIAVLDSNMHKQLYFTKTSVPK